MREILPDGDFIEIFLDVPLEVCEQRDPKGLYKKAIAGDIPNFTGISDPYEAPVEPDIHIRTDKQTPLESANSILEYLEERGLTPLIRLY